MLVTGSLLIVSLLLTQDGTVPAVRDPLRIARDSIGKTRNKEASVPPQCYTKTDGVSNPCWTCHARGHGPNHLIDWELQKEYAFSEFALRNHWSNLFADRSAEVSNITEAEILAYVRTDNYTDLRRRLRGREDYPGFVPDLDYRRGFDDEGFARDGSGWRALRYKPFPGVFWPTNGNTDDVAIRLPARFRSRGDHASAMIYRINLAILEQAIAADPSVRDSRTLSRETEPLDETVAGLDLDGDGTLGRSTKIVGLPAHFVGDASDVPVRRYLHPGGVEYLHTVRYLDPDSATMAARRMKEVRYSRKVLELDDWAIGRAYEEQHEEKDQGRISVPTGSPLAGLRNRFGWLLQAFIEDRDGQLRLQTEEEHRFCLGCHGALGVTVDQTFTLSRKVPGADGWRLQDIRGIADVPQAGHSKPEILTYFERVGGGDEFRANGEIIARFFRDGAVHATEVLRSAPGGDRDIAHLLLPSRPRALALDRAYLAIVRSQSYVHGRDAVLAPVARVHAEIENGSTELGRRGRVFRDGVLCLDWSWRSR